MKLTVSTKNAGKIMQVVNGFFRKSTAVIHKDQIRVEPIFENGILVDYKRQEFDFYEPQLSVTCHWHQLYKEKQSYHPNPPILAISSKYESSCIPLHEGDIIEYKGSILNVKNLEKRSRCIPMSKRQFVHHEFTAEAIHEQHIRLLNGFVSDMSYDDDFFNDFYDRKPSKPYEREIDSARSDAMYERAFATEVQLCTYDNLRVMFNRNLELFISNGLSSENVQLEEIYSYSVLNENNEVLLTSHSYVTVGEFICKQVEGEDVFTRDNADDEEVELFSELF